MIKVGDLVEIIDKWFLFKGKDCPIQGVYYKVVIHPKYGVQIRIHPRAHYDISVYWKKVEFWEL